MTASILVATPHPAFGELLKSSLEESGKYRVHVSLSAREARASSLHGVFQLAILDFALSDEPFIPLCYDLLDQQKGLRLVVVPPENNPNHPALGGLMPHGYLSRPFYLPDLLETVGRLLDERAVTAAATGVNGQAPGRYQTGEVGGMAHTLPDWLTDSETLTRYMEQQLPSTQALAALVGISDPTPGNGALRANAGKLNPTAAQEMTNVVFRYWNRQKKADLMRYVRLNSEKQDYLIYATPLAGELVLTLVYDTNAPLSQVRPQTKAMAQSLAAVPPESIQNGVEPQPDAAAEEGTTTAENETTAAQPLTPAEDANLEPASSEAAPQNHKKSAAQEPETQPLDDPLLFAPPTGDTPIENPSGDAPEEYGEEPEHLVNLSSLLGSIPQPDPGTEAPASFNSSWMTDVPSLTSVPQSSYNGWQPAAEKNSPEESTKGPHGAAIYPYPAAGSKPSTPPAETLEPDQAVEQAGQESPAAESQIILGSEPAIDPLEDTRPRVLTAISSLNQLEPVSPALSLLNYTCVLVPRLPQHYLTGELADRLSHWVQQLCLAFGWRLEGISVRPEYLQWTLQVAPSVSPGNLVRIIRQRTSINIFSHFAHLAEQNPSGDFWATGYLIVSGAQPPSAQLMRDYISQTRKRQGIAR